MNTKDILLYCQFGNYIDLNECACALCSLRKHILFPNNFRQTIKMANGNGNLHCFFVVCFVSMVYDHIFFELAHCFGWVLYIIQSLFVSAFCIYFCQKRPTIISSKLSLCASFFAPTRTKKESAIFQCYLICIEIKVKCQETQCSGRISGNKLIEYTDSYR